MTPSTSRAIYWLQAFLALMVVAIHTGQDIPRTDPLIYLVRFFDYGLTYPTIYCYFLIAGYLMFAGFNRFGRQQYLRVVSRRLVTLVVPWIFWCLLGYLIKVFLFPDYQSPPFWRIDLIFWAQDCNFTLHIPPSIDIPLLGIPFGTGFMYVIRDLFIAALISPLVWWFVRALRLWTIPLMISVFFLIADPGIGPWRGNWIFLPVGAAMSIYHVDLGSLTRRLGWPWVGLWLVLTLGVLWIIMHFDSNHIHNGLWTRLYMLFTILVGIGAYLVLAFKGARRNNSLMFSLVPFAFFILATHNLPIVERPLLHAAGFTNSLLGIPEDYGAVTELVFLIPLRVLLLVGVATLITRLSPRFMGLVTGGRHQRRPHAPREENEIQRRAHAPNEEPQNTHSPC